MLSDLNNYFKMINLDCCQVIGSGINTRQISIPGIWNVKTIIKPSNPSEESINPKAVAR